MTTLAANAAGIPVAAAAGAILIDRPLTQEQRSAPLAPETLDASSRIEGIFDPTRVGPLGPAMRMSVRAGTASMNNLFGDRWTFAFADPNVHFRVRYLALAWMWPPQHRCENLKRFRPNEDTIVFDQLTPGDCAAMAAFSDGYGGAAALLAVTTGATSLPIYASPYPGGRFSEVEMRRLVDARIAAARRRHLVRRTQSTATRQHPVD